MMIIKRKNLFNFQEKLREKFCRLKDYQTIKETEKCWKKRLKISRRKKMNKIIRNTFIFQICKINKYNFQSLMHFKIR